MSDRLRFAVIGSHRACSAWLEANGFDRIRRAGRAYDRDSDGARATHLQNVCGLHVYPPDATLVLADGWALFDKAQDFIEKARERGMKVVEA